MSELRLCTTCWYAERTLNEEPCDSCWAASANRPRWVSRRRSQRVKAFVASVVSRVVAFGRSVLPSVVVIALFIIALGHTVGKVRERLSVREASRSQFIACLQTCDRSDRVGTCIAICWSRRLEMEGE